MSRRDPDLNLAHALLALYAAATLVLFVWWWVS
jgi:hypothetical protein